jgi:hypothetical protein
MNHQIRRRAMSLKRYRACAAHQLAPAGAGTLVRTAGHHAALEQVVLSAFTASPPCQRKGNHAPGAAARGEAARRLAGPGTRRHRRPEPVRRCFGSGAERLEVGQATSMSAPEVRRLWSGSESGAWSAG